MVIERSLVLIKHDGVARSLIGRIVSRLEDLGLKIIGIKMVWADENLAKNHYVLEEEWANKMFERVKKTKESLGEPFPYKDAMTYAKRIQTMNIEFLREGPVVALVFEGPHAIELIRKTIGSTEPRQASPGTIRGDFAGVESYALADSKSRVLRNLIHASDSVSNGEREISLWFNKSEIHSYKKDLDKHF